MCGKSHSTWRRQPQEGCGSTATTARPPRRPCPHLQDRPAGPGAVLAQILLALGRAELQQLLPLQLMAGEAGQELEEGAAGDTGDVQVLGHEALNGAGLGQPHGAGDTCSEEREAGGGWGRGVGAARGLGTQKRAQCTGGSSGGWGLPGSRGCSVKCWSGSRPSAWQNCWTWLAVFSGWISTTSPATKLWGTPRALGKLQRKEGSKRPGRAGGVLGPPSLAAVSLLCPAECPLWKRTC